MLDIKFVRENPDKLKEALGQRGMGDFFVPEVELSLGQLLEMEDRRRQLLKEVEELRNRRNVVSEEIGRLKREKKDADPLLTEMKGVSDKIKELDETLGKVEETAAIFLRYIPNIPHASVPVGKDEAENKVVRTWGEPKDLGFPPLNHWDIGEMLGIIDFDRASKIAGARFALMRGAGARLERALMNFMLDLNTSKGYTEVFPPILVNRESMTGTGQLPKFEMELFRIADPEFYLIPTAEVPVTNIHRDEILKEDDLPLYYTAYTPCFRREAGSYGKDTRGLIRQHQFNKVELVKFVTPESSYEELEKLTSDAEDILQKLCLPYRVVALCTGDLGFSAAKTYDLEVWLQDSSDTGKSPHARISKIFRQGERTYGLSGRGKRGQSLYIHSTARAWL